MSDSKSVAAAEAAKLAAWLAIGKMWERASLVAEEAAALAAEAAAEAKTGGNPT